MPKNITIAKLDIDTQALQESIQKTEKEIDKLAEKQDKLIKKGKEGSDKFRENANELSILNGTHQMLSKSLTASEATFNDYKQQVAESFQQINLFNGGLGGFISRAQEAGGVGSLMKDSFAGMTDGIKGMGKALTSNPIGLIVAAVQAVIGVFKDFTPIVETVEQAMAAVGAVVQSVANAFIGLFTGDAGSFFSSITTGAAEAAGAAIELKKAQQELNKEIELQEIKNQEAVASIENLMDKVKDQTKSEEERIALLDKATSLEKQNYDQRKKQAEELYNQAVQQIAIGKNLTQEELKNLTLKGAAYAAELAKRKNISDEELQTLKKAQLERSKIYDEEKGITQKHTQELEKIHQDAERQRDEREKKKAKQIQDAIEGQRLELQLLITNQGIKGKASMDELALAEEVAKRKRKIALAEYNASEKTANDKRRLDLANAEITRDLTEVQAKTAVKTAEREIEAYRQKNQTLIKEGELMSDAVYAKEKERIDATLEAETKFLVAKKSNGLLSEQEYQSELDNLRKTHDAAIAETDKQKQDAQRTAIAKEADEKATAYENDMAAAEGRYQEQLKIEDQRHIDEGLRLKALLDNKLISEQEYNALSEAETEKTEKNKANINKAATDAKLNLANQTFGNLAAIMGKESAAGKAMAVAQATIDTYKSATAAYSAMSGIPIVGPALGAVAAAAAVAAGVANVKKITSTKPPKAEKGALFSIGGQRHSAGGTLFTGADGTQFEAEQGELIGVMNRNAARHFMAFNNAFPAGGASAPNYFAGGGIVSREIAQQNLNTDELALKIAEANRNLPSPVVAVQDIVTEGNSYVRVRDSANF
ncbi:hypothetical protein [Flavobacterium suzhouense]|uniref:Uncharacterized protein n=1 Tax=Flavobacterium suzhouense TaxID=1529638 RepID=A0ABW5NP32_9FLAO